MTNILKDIIAKAETMTIEEYNQLYKESKDFDEVIPNDLSNMHRKCPMCGRKDLYTLDTTGEVGYISMRYTCPDCKTSFDEIDEVTYTNHLNKENRKFVLEVVATITMEKFWTIPAIERVLEIKQGTIRSWKENENKYPTIAEVTLFRFLKVYPWLLLVADFDYDPKIATSLIRGAYNSLDEKDK